MPELKIPSKFNLPIDGKPIRDLDALKANFNIEDLLEVYEDGRLRRWLQGRDLHDEVSKLDNVKGNPVEKARELCRVFYPDCTEEQVKEAVYSLEIRRKDEEKFEQRKSNDEIFSSYYTKYKNLLLDMETEHDDYPFIKTTVMQIYRRYRRLFCLDLVRFYERYVFSNPLVIMAILAHKEMRGLLTEIITEQEIYNHLIYPVGSIKSYYSTRYTNKIPIFFSKHCETSDDLKELQDRFSSVFVLEFLSNSKLPSQGKTAMCTYFTKDLSPSFKYIDRGISNRLPQPPFYGFSGVTTTHWKAIKREGNWMIIYIPDDSFVRSVVEKEKEFRAEDVNGKFPILTGIEYKSNSSSDEWLYMAV